MVTISLCMIVKNEEDTLGDCLESVAGLVEEIIIIDTGSTDRTKEIAIRFTDKIFDFAWVDDFAAARNYSFSKATMDYLLWLDADDRLLDADRIKFKELKLKLDPMVDLVMMPYHAGFDPSGNLTLSYVRERLVKREANFQWKEPVHEYIEPSGVIIDAEINITHHKKHTAGSRRNLEIYQKQLALGRAFNPRALLYYAMELYYHSYYEEAKEKFLEFVETGEGWVEDNIKANFYLGKSYQNLNNPEKAMRSFLCGFEYDLPRAEHCCEIGYLYKSKKEYQKAIFWFELATSLKKPENNWGFFFHDYWGYIPFLELSICYYWMGNLAEAIHYNEKAGISKPNDPAVLYNRQFYQTIGSSHQIAKEIS